MDNNLQMSIICLVGAIFFIAGKMASEDMIKTISESDRWPLDDWKIVTLGLEYAHKIRLSREEVLKRAKSDQVITKILFWIFLCASVFFGAMWAL